jgi:hypothetical protein
MPVPDFSPGEVLTAGAMDSIGLWLIGSTSFTTTANPFINGCFSSNFENYVVKFMVEASTPVNLNFRVRSGTSTTEMGAVYDAFGFFWNGAAMVNAGISNQTSGKLCDVTNVGGNRSAGTVDFFGPNTPRPTIVNTQTWDSNNGFVYYPSFRIETNTAYTGIELVPSSGTLTGSMRVYGLRN